jgi:hypothetical protein
MAYYKEEVKKAVAVVLQKVGLSLQWKRRRGE